MAPIHSGNKKWYSFSLLLLLFMSCVEPFEVGPQTFDDVLVVEATLTNEMKKQSITLSRTSVLGSTERIAETGAKVRLLQDAGAAFEFIEVDQGLYEFPMEFSVQPGIEYQLTIDTKDGESYISNPEVLPAVTEIDDLVAVRTRNDDGLEGIEIRLNSFDSSGQSRYYRYAYDETYKIIAPQWNQFEAIVISEEPPEVDIVPRSQEEQICYGTSSSTTSILFNTVTLEEDRVSDLSIRFIEKSDFFIAHRYSILVKQFVQSENAFEYYRKLDELSNQGNLLSPSQPGFLIGNVFGTDEGSRSVTGYFDISAVSSKRIFFNFDDFFDDTSSPAYVVGCEQILKPTLERDGFGNSALILAIQNETLEYFNDNEGSLNAPPEGGPFEMVPRICGDCTTIGSNVVPEFWVE